MFASSNIVSLGRIVNSSAISQKLFDIPSYPWYLDSKEKADMSNAEHKVWRTKDAQKAIARVKRIRRELADWPMTSARRAEKEREIVAIRAAFKL